MEQTQHSCTVIQFFIMLSVNKKQCNRHRDHHLNSLYQFSEERWALPPLRSRWREMSGKKIPEIYRKCVVYRFLELILPTSGLPLLFLFYCLNPWPAPGHFITLLL